MAGGCPLLRDYTTVGERIRKCSFAEGFKSSEDLIRNSESITGAPNVVDGVCTFNGASNVVYKRQVFSRSLTFQISFKTSSLQANKGLISSWDGALASGIVIEIAANGNVGIYVYSDSGVGICGYAAQYIGVNPTYYADNNWHTILATVNRETNRASVVIDGVVVVNNAVIAANAETIGTRKPLIIGSTYIGGSFFTGQIKDVKLWDTALDVAEAQAYYNNTMFQFHNRAALSLPMTAACHDAVNGRTLDVSGNGNHAVFAAGAQAPVKLSRRGYSFTQASSQYMDSPFLVTNANWTICVLCQSKRATDRNYMFSIDAGAVNGLITEFFAANQMNWISAQVGVGIALTPHQGYSVRAFAVSRLDVGGGNKLYSLGVDGVIRGTSTSANEQLFDFVRIGARGDFGGYYFNGEIYKLEAWREALNNTQIAEWYATALNEVNRV